VAPFPAELGGCSQSLLAAHNRQRLAVPRLAVHSRQELAAPVAAVELVVQVPAPEVVYVVEAVQSAGALGVAAPKVAAPKGRSHLAAVCQSPQAVAGRLPQPGALAPSGAAPEGRPPVPQSVSVACPVPA